MASGLSIQLVGFEALERRLSDMPGKIERKCYRTALRSIANKAKRRMQAGAPVLSGIGKKSVKVKVRVRRGGAYAVVKPTQRPQLYLRLYDQGSKRQPARPWMESAIGDFRSEATGEFLTALKAAVENNQG
jgi:HK97 gp10 family phage protein